MGTSPHKVLSYKATYNKFIQPRACTSGTITTKNVQVRSTLIGTQNVSQHVWDHVVLRVTLCKIEKEKRQ